jgi:hypothetical protein
MKSHTRRRQHQQSGAHYHMSSSMRSGHYDISFKQSRDAHRQRGNRADQLPQLGAMPPPPTDAKPSKISPGIRRAPDRVCLSAVRSVGLVAPPDSKSSAGPARRRRDHNEHSEANRFGGGRGNGQRLCRQPITAIATPSSVPADKNAPSPGISGSCPDSRSDSGIPYTKYPTAPPEARST